MTDFRQTIRAVAKQGSRFVQAVKHPAIGVSLLVAGVVLGVRELGGWEAGELLAYDQMLRLRPSREADSRLLIVGITEADIRSQNRYPLSDQTVATLLAKLQQFRPRAIGLDLYRDVAQPPGRTALLRQLQAPNVVAVRLLDDGAGGSVPAPAMPPTQVGFNDLVVDPDTVIRRNFLFASLKSERLFSFALQLSLKYLGPQALPLAVDNNAMYLGPVQFSALTQTAGGYRKLDDRGYQVLLNYQSARPIGRQVSLTQVLENKVEASWVADKVVLIGMTASSAKDLFHTPYDLSHQSTAKTPGLLIHAQMTSQILSHVLDGQSLIWYWSDPIEMIWIWLWAAIGAGLAWRLRRPWQFGIGLMGAVGGVWGVCWGALLYAGWLPFLPAVLALAVSSIGMMGYRLVNDTAHDPLTGLPNRLRFRQLLQVAMMRLRVHQNCLQLGAKRSPQAARSLQSAHPNQLERRVTAPRSLIAVLLLGLDSFKAINDSYGPQVGDQLLIAITQRLRTCLRSSDQLARTGGDEFAILCSNVHDVSEVLQLADRLQQQMTVPFWLDGREVFTSVSVGIVVDSISSEALPEDLLRDAQTAMHRAKAAGKARHELFALDMREQVLARLQLETDLRYAIERQQLEVHYQPIVCLETGRIAGFEALVRWRHPERGLVSPDEFIPIAEETGIILPIGEWIIRVACHQLRHWQRTFPTDPPLLVSVNLSSKQFAQPLLVEQISQQLADAGLDARSLKLEITESMAMTDVEATIGLLQRLKALNLQLSIDDFGTGYSSLSYLHRFPTHTIKVDRSFVSRMGYEREDAHIVQTIIILGHNLGMDIIAEGVETAEQLATLRDLQCEYAQGFFFSKPLPPEAAEALLRRDPHW